MRLDLIDTSRIYANRFGSAREIRNHDPRTNHMRVRSKQYAIVVFGGRDRDPESSIIRQFTQRHLEISLGTIGALHLEKFRTGNGWSQQQTLRHQVKGPARGISL